MKKDYQRHTVGEEFFEHESVVGFRMVARKSNIFVHVESDYIFKTEWGE